MSLEGECSTRWLSKLSWIEKYIVPKPHLDSVWPESAPTLTENTDENCLADCIVVIREVRRVARAFEASKFITSSRAPRLLKELSGTLRIFSANRQQRNNILSTIGIPRTSKNCDDRVLLSSRNRGVLHEEARLLSKTLLEQISGRLSHLYTVVNDDVLLARFEGMSDDAKNNFEKVDKRRFFMPPPFSMLMNTTMPG